MGGMRSIDEYKALFPGLELEIEKVCRAAMSAGTAPSRSRSLWHALNVQRWLVVLLLAVLVGATTLVAVQLIASRRQAEIADAFYAAFDTEDLAELDPTQRARVDALLPDFLRQALELDPNDARAWDPLFTRLKNKLPVRRIPFDMIYPTGTIARTHPLFRFGHPDATLPYMLTLHGESGTMQFPIPVHDGLPIVTFPLPENTSLQPGTYRWQISVDRARLEELDPPILNIPEPNQASFELIGSSEVDELRKQCYVTSEAALDTYFFAYALLDRDLAELALANMNRVRMQGADKRFHIEDHWRFLHARAYTILDRADDVERLYRQTYASKVPLPRTESRTAPAPRPDRKGQEKRKRPGKARNGRKGGRRPARRRG